MAAITPELLGLPPELRDMIYDFAIHTLHLGKPTMVHASALIALVRSTNVIRQELAGKHYEWANCKVTFSAAHHMEPLPPLLPDCTARSITNVNLDLTAMPTKKLDVKRDIRPLTALPALEALTIILRVADSLTYSEQDTLIRRTIEVMASRTATSKLAFVNVEDPRVALHRCGIACFTQRSDEHIHAQGVVRPNNRLWEYFTRERASIRLEDFCLWSDETPACASG